MFGSTGPSLPPQGKISKDFRDFTPFGVVDPSTYLYVARDISAAVTAPTVNCTITVHSILFILLFTKLMRESLDISDPDTFACVRFRPCYGPEQI